MNAASIIVTQAIIEYSQINPDIIFNVSQERDSDLDDIVICSNMPQIETALSCHFSISERIFAAVPESNEKYKNRSTISLAELKDESFVCLMGSRQLRSICDQYCKTAGFTPKIIFESDNPTSVRNMIAARVGVGFWPEFSWGNSKIDSAGVRLLEIKDPECTREIHITCSKEAIDNNRIAEFYEFLKHFFEDKFA